MAGSKKNGLIRRGFQGAMGGAAATGSMSAFFGLSDVCGYMNNEPPRLIVQKFLPMLSPDETDAAALVSHVGYGVSAGTLYGALVPPRWRGVITGVAYGLAIWAVSYEGWVPALGIMPTPQKDKPGRAITLLLAHIVYGGTLGVVARRRAR